MPQPTIIKIDEIEYVRRDSLTVPARGVKGPIVVARSPSAGVFVGELVSRAGGEVTLANARNINYWKGARTLNEVSQNGIKDGSRVSEPVPELLILGVVEIIQVSDRA